LLLLLALQSSSLCISGWPGMFPRKLPISLNLQVNSRLKLLLSDLDHEPMISTVFQVDRFCIPGFVQALSWFCYAITGIDGQTFRSPDP
jgi:hypothetical protein